MDNESLEYSVVGAICIDERVLDRISSFLTADDFGITACATVYDAALDAVGRGKTFDAVIAADLLRKSVVDSDSFIKHCMDECPSCTNAVEHAQLLHERASIKRFREAVGAALENERPEDQPVAIAGICQEYLKGRTGGDLHTFSDALVAAYMGLSESDSFRIDTGFPKLDGILKGLWPGNLAIVGARPGVGKSAFALGLAETAARHGFPVLLCSLEMTDDEVAERSIARNDPAVVMDDLIDRKLSGEQRKCVAGTCSRISTLPIHICDKPNIGVAYIRALARSMPALRLIIVDYIGLMRADGRYDSRNLELGAISRELKNMASELKLPVVALAQLNRSLDETEQPKLQSLRDSGELEQNANKILFIWHVDKDSGIVGVSVAKNRRGRTGAVQMRFCGERMKFVEMQEDYKPKKRRREIDEE